MNVSRETSFNSNNRIGQAGESLVADFLCGKGYRVVLRNYRTKFGEIDIVALSPDKTLVFIEVKTLRDSGGISPEDHFGGSKRLKMGRACIFFANRHPELIDSLAGWRMDLVALTLRNKDCEINHYQNV